MRAPDTFRFASVSELHLLEEWLPARISAHAVEQRIQLHRGQASIVEVVCTIQPLEAKIGLPATGVSLRDLIGAAVWVLLDQRLQRRPRVGIAA